MKNELKINNTQDVCDSKDKTKRQEKCYEKLLNLIKKNTEVETILVEAENITDKNVSECTDTNISLTDTLEFPQMFKTVKQNAKKDYY